MKTDVPLKRLTVLRPHDLIPLLGLPAVSIEEVTVRELPFPQKRLDTLLRVRSPHGQVYLHLLEWQAYFDPAVLWRIITYLGVLGVAYPSMTLIATIMHVSQAGRRRGRYPHDDYRWRGAASLSGALHPPVGAGRGGGGGEWQPRADGA